MSTLFFTLIAVYAIIFLYNNIGNLHTNLKEFSAAEDYYLKSLAIEKELENNKGVEKELIGS